MENNREYQPDIVKPSAPPTDQQAHNVVQMPDPIQPLPATPSTTKKLNKKYVLIAGGLLLLIAAGLIFLNRQSPKPNNKSTAHNRTSVINNVQPQTNIAFQSKLKAYVQKSSLPKTSIYTLTDQNGTKLSQRQGPSELKLIAAVGSGSLLLIDNSDIRNTDYYLFSESGLKKLSNLGTDLTVTGQERGVGAIGVRGYGSDSIIYQYCPPNPNQSAQNCDIRVTNLTSGAEKVFKIDQLNSYGAHLSTLNPDNKSAYFIGVSPDSVKDLQKQADKITGGQLLSENNPKVDQLYKLTLKRTILQVDLSSKKIVGAKDVTTQYTYYGKFWVSPNGQNLVYSNGGEKGELQYVRIVDDKTEIIKLPKATFSTEPFGATTTTFDPLFSPDGSRMAFVTYGLSKEGSLESAGIINFADLSVQMIANEPAGTASISYFGNFRWLDSDHFDFTQDGSNFSYSIGDTSPKESKATYGSLLGLADGYH